MLVKVLYSSGYNFTGDSGKPVIGYNLHICSPESMSINDGKGNFKIGFPTDILKISGFDADRLGLVYTDIMDLQGKLVDLQYEKLFGKDKAKVSSIKVIE